MVLAGLFVAVLSHLSSALKPKMFAGLFAGAPTVATINLLLTGLEKPAAAQQGATGDDPGRPRHDRLLHRRLTSCAAIARPARHGRGLGGLGGRHLHALLAGSEVSLWQKLADELRREHGQPVGIDRDQLLQAQWAPLGLRFVFGGAIALVAGLVGMRFGPRVDGLFLAFPAVLPAALTLIESKEGPAKTDTDALGAILGSAAMVVFAAVVAVLVARVGAPLAVAVGAAAWVMVALALFAGLRRLLHGAF
jgi:uncharacterized membrane protein (GlpM family)